MMNQSPWKGKPAVARSSLIGLYAGYCDSLPMFGEQGGQSFPWSHHRVQRGHGIPRHPGNILGEMSLQGVLISTRISQNGLYSGQNTFYRQQIVGIITWFVEHGAGGVAFQKGSDQFSHRNLAWCMGIFLPCMLRIPGGKDNPGYENGNLNDHYAIRPISPRVINTIALSTRLIKKILPQSPFIRTFEIFLKL
jgi:hypothetical protein